VHSAIGGSSSARARTAVDLAVPFSPLIKTPPKAGLITFKIRDSFISSCPTIAVKGYTAVRFIYIPPFIKKSYQ